MLTLQMECSLIVLVRDRPWWTVIICDFVGNIPEYHREVQQYLLIQNKDGQQMGATVFSSEGFFVVRERERQTETERERQRGIISNAIVS